MTNITIGTRGYGYDNLVATKGYGQQLDVYPFEDGYAPTVRETKLFEFDIYQRVEYDYESNFEMYVGIEVDIEVNISLNTEIINEAEFTYEVQGKIDKNRLKQILSLL